MSTIEHPWSDAKNKFMNVTLPKLEKRGKEIGKAGKSGDETANKIMQHYQLLYRSFDPMTALILDEQLAIWLKSNPQPADRGDQ